MQVTVRAQEPQDAEAVRTVLTDAFGDDGQVATLAEALLAGPAQVALIAEVDHEVVGSVMLSRSWLDAPTRVVDVLVLSPLGIARRHQNQGIGGLLVRAAIEAAAEQQCPIVFLEGEPDYYPRFGFVPGAGRGFTAPSVRIPDVAFQVVTLPAWEPWMTGAFAYCDAFWQHDAVGLRNLGTPID